MGIVTIINKNKIYLAGKMFFLQAVSDTAKTFLLISFTVVGSDNVATIATHPIMLDKTSLRIFPDNL